MWTSTKIHWFVASETLKTCLCWQLFELAANLINCPHLAMVKIPVKVAITSSRYHQNPLVKVVMWSRWGLTWRSQVGANPIPIPHPTNMAFFGHKITVYRFNQGVGRLILLQGRAQIWAGGAEPPWPHHFNHLPKSNLFLLLVIRLTPQKISSKILDNFLNYDLQTNKAKTSSPNNWQR